MINIRLFFIKDDLRNRIDIKIVIGDKENILVIGEPNEISKENPENKLDPDPYMDVLMVRMPKPIEIEATKLTIHRRPSQKTVYFKSGDDPSIIMNFIKANSGGYIAKSLPLILIVESMKNLFHEDLIIDQAEIETMINKYLSAFKN